MDAKSTLWFSQNKKFSHLGHEGETPIHPFFDYPSGISTEENNVNAIIVTPEASSVAYGLDLYSGKIYFDRSYCPQLDVWKTYGGNIESPPFSIGFIPRFLDQQAYPQKVIIFGKPAFSAQTPSPVSVKVIGGLVTQYCQDTLCNKLSKWDSRFVLIAVDSSNKDWKEITNLKSLKERVDWQEVVAHLENGEGRTILVGKETPYVRTVGLINAKYSLKKMIAVGHQFNLKSMEQMQKSCHNIYSDLIVLRKEKDLSRLKNKIFEYRKKLPICFKYVQASSINDSSEDHWFMSLIRSLVLADSLGYFYDCKNRLWYKNYETPLKKGMINFWKRFQGCSLKNLSPIFDSSVQLLDRLLHSGQKSYIYLQYDDGVLGTNQKLYSWVYKSGKKFSCEKNEKLPLSTKERKTFPKDILWGNLFSVGEN